jgi:hypothetical protein
VLPETVGPGAKTNWRAYQTRVAEASGYIEGPEPKRLLVSCQDVCDQLRIVERILTGSGACFTTHIVDRDSLSGHGPMTYPIRRSLFVVCPHAYYLHGLNVVEHLIDKTVLNI